MLPLNCPTCSGTRFSFAAYDVHVFDAEAGQVYDAETSGREDLICRNCGQSVPEDHPLIEAMQTAWECYLGEGKTA